MKHIERVYIEMFLMCLELLVILCLLVLYLHYSSEKLAVGCRSDITGRFIIIIITVIMMFSHPIMGGGLHLLCYWSK